MAKDGKIRLRMGWLAILVVVVGAGAFGVTALLVDIFEKRQEAQNPFYRVVELTDDTTDPAIWGKNFPLQYDSFTRTVDQTRTRYGGSEALPRTPTDADPRSVVAQSRLEEDPRLRTMWAGYAFAEDFREERGHAYMLADQMFTGRQAFAQQPGTCLHCHASVYVPYKEAGNGDLFAGFEKLNQMPYQDAVKHVNHPVSCIDCHNPQTMELRVTRPAFMEGIKKVQAARGKPDFDVNRDATRQEMRTYVCAQCHVEYHFSGPEKRLVYPWENGMKADQILSHYEEIGFKDWTHRETGAAALKAQHPEFEMYSQGVHARSGVACADCHMPYVRVGAMKMSDHHVRSPLLNINNACQTCHRFSEDELLARAELIQQNTMDMRNVVMDALVALIADISKAKEAGKNSDALATAQRAQRRGGFLLDFVEAENSMGFHAPQESARVLLKALEEIRAGHVALHGGEPKTMSAETAGAAVSPGMPQPLMSGSPRRYDEERK